jgi:hypothetical protein
MLTSCRRCRTFRAFFKHVLQHLSVQRQVRYDPFRLRVLFFQLSQAAQLDRAQPAVLLLPRIERCFTDAEFAAHFRVLTTISAQNIDSWATRSSD